MDWVAIGTAALAGAMGGLLGGLIAMPIKAKNLKLVVTVALTVAAIAVGREVLTPYAEAEYLVRIPEMQPLVQMAPAHVDELKALLRDAYEKGGTEADFRQAGFLFAHRYASARMTDLFASKNGALASRSFDRYMKLFAAAYAHNRVTCYDWMEGFSRPSDDLGFTPAEAGEFAQLMSDAQTTSQLANAPLSAKLEPALQEQVTNSVNAHWNTQEIDFDGMSHPEKDMPADRKAKVCYTAFAYFTEIQRLPMADKLTYLRAMFGPTRT